MKATCEIVVDREMLLTALHIDSGPYELMGPDELEIYPGLTGITFVTASVDAELEAAGAWDHLVLTSRWLVADLLERTSQPTVKLFFVGNQLFVDRIAIPAEDGGPMEGFSSQRTRRRGASQPHQQSLRLLEPAGTRLRARRAQVPPDGLPLFGV